MITIDGSQGEGGGQILRTSLALSLVTGQPFRMERIRAKRQKPGMLKQHLTAVEAAKTVGCAEADGASLSSQTLEFRPGPVTPGNYRFAVGLPERGSMRNRQAQILVSKLPEHVGQRELTVVRDELKWRADECGVEVIQHPVGPGNAVVLAIETEHVTEVFTGFGERGRPAEDVARSAVLAAKTWLESNVPVDEHLADQLLIPMALAGGGSFRTTKPRRMPKSSSGSCPYQSVSSRKANWRGEFQSKSSGATR